VTRAWIAGAALALGCGGGAASGRGAVTLRAACDAGSYHDGSACVPRGDGAALIDRGAAALAEFNVDAALPLLERARTAGPFAHAEHARLYEQLGIAYAYVEREADALAAFATLLRLDPGHLLSYTLSPRATFLFETARRKAAGEPAPAVALTWPRDVDAARPVPVDVEVLADPAGSLARAQLHVRARGAEGYQVADLALPAGGSYERVVLPASGVKRNGALEIYLTAHDRDGNEVLVWAEPDRPREIPLRYDPPSPWYRKWWVWAIAGSVVAAGTGATVFAVTREPSDTVGGDFVVER
jgi:tetratricopeptide (TPR) repeat protein